MTSESYKDYILEQLEGAGEIRCRKMMGEYLLYCDGRLFGGLYDDRFLVKPIDAARRMLPDAPEELPYPGAKPMLLVTETDDRAFLAALITEMLPELPVR